MPLRMNVGASRKVTDNNHGSRGASVNLELELDGSLVSEPTKLHEKIRQLFALVRVSLAEELNGGNGNGHGAPSDHARAETPPQAPTNGNGPSRSNAPRTNAPRPATESQCKALYAIARSQQLDLAPFLRERYQVGRPDDLTIKQASEAIDALKASDPREGGGR